MDDQYENFDELNITNFRNYGDYLSKFITKEDKMYLDDDDLARELRELYANNKGDIKSKEDFDRKKREIEMRDQVDEKKEKPLYSEGKKFEEGSFLHALQQREYDVRNGRIIFIRYRDINKKEISAYIDYRERLKTDNFDDIFNGKKDLVPKASDLSYYNWSSQKVTSGDSTFFRVDAGHKERLSFRNKTDRKIINVDLGYLDQHKNLDLKRTAIKLADLPEDNKPGYRKIAIFDYETRTK